MARSTVTKLRPQQKKTMANKSHVQPQGKKSRSGPSGWAPWTKNKWEKLELQIEEQRKKIEEQEKIIADLKSKLQKCGAAEVAVKKERPSPSRMEIAEALFKRVTRGDLAKHKHTRR
eukprot:TRINITY_DN23308_c0_g1_i1.p1 TRINITY_DN23308_c0_g1~~TRINITY_DN23308_c0_g1_i1.p1  ORF type:complete len:136 (+),score=23.12 TRINITY_DN23308_c0_g1_i1:58-408(+)